MPLALARAGVEDAAIGLVMGAAAAIQLPAALVGGRLVDTFGAPRLFTTGGILYLLASGVLLLPGVDVEGDLAPFVLARMLQAAGAQVTEEDAYTELMTGTQEAVTALITTVLQAFSPEDSAKNPAAQTDHQSQARAAEAN